MDTSRFLNQTITYWANPLTDGWGGYTFDDPIAISGRWEDRQELFIDAEGREVRSQAVVYLNQDVELGGYLALGTHTDSSDTDPRDVSEAHKIRSFQKIPDVKGSTYVRKAWL